MTMIIWKVGEDRAVLLEDVHLVRTLLSRRLVWIELCADVLYVCIAGSTSQTGNAYYDAARDSRRAPGAH